MSDLQATALRKTFSTPSREIVILDGLSLALNRGENLAIIGPSGAGKSTLLHILGTLDSPTSGEVVLGGQNPFALSERDQARFRNEKIGFVFQDHHLLPQWNVLENTLLPALASGTPSNAIRDRGVALLARVGLSDRIQHLPNQLSGGERERVAVARALLLKPLLVLADEPTGNLDGETAQSVSQLLLEIPREENAMLIVVTHSMDLANQMQTRMELRRGSLHPKP